jgi:methylglyoxal synthase
LTWQARCHDHATGAAIRLPDPHDPDVKALLRLAVARNIPVACSRASADFLISSPLLRHAYDRIQPDFADYAHRGWSALATTADQVA